MRTIAQIVESIIKQKPFLVESMIDGLVNISSLARRIQPDIERELHKEIQTGAVVMALKRLVPNLQLIQASKLGKMLSGIGDIIVRSDLCDYCYKNSDSLKSCHGELMNRIDNDKEIFYTVVQGVFETNLVMSSVLMKDVEKVFKDQKLLRKQDKLSSITFKLPQGNVMQPGLYYFIMKELAWEAINIEEVISTSHEFTFLVNDEDIDRAFLVIKRFK